MKAGLDGRAALSPSFVEHFDACLGCMACVTACPSGVQYAPLIEATRGQIDRRHERSLGDRLFRRLIFAIVPHPGAIVATDDLVAHCRDQLASYKKPRQVFFVESLPRNALGKIQKHVLREGLVNGPEVRPSN